MHQVPDARGLYGRGDQEPGAVDSVCGQPAFAHAARLPATRAVLRGHRESRSLLARKRRRIDDLERGVGVRVTEAFRSNVVAEPELEAGLPGTRDGVHEWCDPLGVAAVPCSDIEVRRAAAQ